MGGGSGIALIDNINPFHHDDNVSATLGNAFQGAASNSPELIKGVATVAAIAYGGYAIGGALGAGEGAAVGAGAAEGGAASAASEGYLGADIGGTAAGASASGVGYLGAETTLSGTGVSAAELGGAAASSPAAVDYASGYLGADIGSSAYAPTAEGYLGADFSSTVADAPWYASLIPSGGTVLGLANTYLNATRSSGAPGGGSGTSAPTLKTPTGYLTSPAAPGSTISIGGQGSTSPQSTPAMNSTLLLTVGALGLLYLASKKRMI